MFFCNSRSRLERHAKIHGARSGHAAENAAGIVRKGGNRAVFVERDGVVVLGTEHTRRSETAADFKALRRGY